MRNAGTGVAEGTIDFLTNTNTFDVLSLKRFNFYTSLANFDNLALSKLPVCRIIDLLVHPKEKIMKKTSTPTATTTATKTAIKTKTTTTTTTVITTCTTNNNKKQQAQQQQL